MSPILKKYRSQLCHHTTAVLNLLLCIGFVLPLPVADSAAAGSCSVNDAVTSRSSGSDRVAKVHSVPFPCQNRPCGCRSADSCLSKCCCFTAEQKVAWAQMHGHGPTPEPSKTSPRKTIAKADTPKTENRWRTVSFVRSMECQGLGIAGACFLVTLPAAGCHPALDAAGADFSSPASDRLPAASLQPPVPPPRLIV